MGVGEGDGVSDPWKRKRKCGNCYWWMPPERRGFMGECSLTQGHVSSLAVCLNEVLATSSVFYCCQYRKVEVPDAQQA